MSHFDPYGHLHYIKDLETKAQARVRGARRSDHAFGERARSAAAMFATVISGLFIVELVFGIFA